MRAKLDIRTFRETRGWSQEKLASELGVDQATVSRWETGNAKPRGYLATAMEALGRLHPPAQTEAAQ